MRGHTNAIRGRSVFKIVTNYYTSGTQSGAYAGDIVSAKKSLDPITEGYFLVFEDGRRMSVLGDFFIMPSQDIQFIGV